MARYFEADKNSTIRYYLDGLLHREDGPAVVYLDGGKEWSLMGRRHRIDGPALEYPGVGILEWYVDGLLHNEDGPAVTYDNGFKSYYLNNIRISESEFIMWKLKNFLK